MATYTCFSDFYPFYLQEHQNKTSRILHFIGTLLVLLQLGGYLYILPNWWFWFSLPLTGYGFAWVGHFFFEKNRPATFRYPLWSLRGDFTLFFEILLQKRGFDGRDDKETAK